MHLKALIKTILIKFYFFLILIPNYFLPIEKSNNINYK